RSRGDPSGVIEAATPLPYHPRESPERRRSKAPMSDVYAPYFEAFPVWLRTLGEDVEELASLLDDASLGEEARESVAGGLNYLFKSLDLIPDGVEHLGYLDDCFVIRVAAELA